MKLGIQKWDLSGIFRSQNSKLLHLKPYKNSLGLVHSVHDHNQSIKHICNLDVTKTSKSQKGIVFLAPGCELPALGSVTSKYPLKLTELGTLVHYA